LKLDTLIYWISDASIDSFIHSFILGLSIKKTKRRQLICYHWERTGSTSDYGVRNKQNRLWF
jgi:hypothetical protein